MSALARLHQLFRNMEVVGKLQECDKLSTIRVDFYIDKPTYTCPFLRALRGDRYDINVQNVEGNIHELVRVVMNIGDTGYIDRAVEHLQRAHRGLVNLERTYIDRVQAQAAILVLREDLGVRIANLSEYKNGLKPNDSFSTVTDALVRGWDAAPRSVLLCPMEAVAEWDCTPRTPLPDLYRRHAQPEPSNSPAQR